MNFMLKWKWPIIAAWVVVAVVLLAIMPNIDQLVRDKGQIGVPEGYSSTQASHLLEAMGDESEDEREMSVILVFNSPEKLTADQMTGIEQGLAQLESKKQELGLVSLQTHVNFPEAKDQLLSADGTTVMALASADTEGRTKDEIRDSLTAALKNVPVSHYLTGPALINEDFTKTTQEGVKKTELVAVIFIVVVLILIFRSPVTPLISLLAVALSFLVSLGIVTQLVDKVDFPFSGFTQIFLVLVLFGIGTDYNILLFMRFKEELARTDSRAEAIVRTYSTAGKTVIYSGAAVLIGFCALGLAEFQLFKSASAVGIGVGVLLIALFTFLPVMMGLLGPRIFWPSKAAGGHSENRIISGITGFAVKRPIWGVVITLAIAVPISLFYSSQLSYNSLDEVDDSYPSVQGIHVIYDHYSAGQAMPATLAMQSDEEMDSAGNLAFIDKVTERLSQVEGVDKVYSATRPKGEKIAELYTSNQSQKLSEGIQQANEGIGTIRDGLTKAADQVAAVPLEDLGKAGELVAGTKKVQDGIDQSISALNKIATGMEQGTAGAGDLKKGLTDLRGSLAKLNDSTGTIASGLQAISGGYGSLYSQYNGIQQSVQSLVKVSEAMNDSVAKLEQSETGLADNPDFATLKSTAASLTEQLNKLSSGIETLNGQFDSANGKLAQLEQGLKQIQSGQQQIEQGARKLESGSSTLQSGLAEASEGQRTVTGRMPALSEGLKSIEQGQTQLNKGLDALSANLPALETGLKDSVAGLQKVSDGLASTTDYLDEMSGTSGSESFFIPEEVRTGAEFAQSLDMYMSEDRRTAKWSVVLSDDPYSTAAMDSVDRVHEVYKQLAKESGFSEAEYGIGGVASQNLDLKEVSGGDFTRTAAIMLAGILLVLLFISRAFWLPVAVIGSLVLAYYTALTLTEWIFGAFTEHGDLAWTIPFFSFIMIVALGVDYSIFLIMRYQEYQEMDPRRAIHEAMKHTGGIILSAAIILSGTFAAMYPSGVLTLVQMATVVIIALMLLAFLFLPLFLPAVVAIVNRSKSA
ncbi:MMPL family transporter [Cohnella thailandensis]|uniref:MMPL family transporter n=1 Tax=Cohnella thailandensis TaxID=557557 RepID=A0A841T1Z9_9BACL|nr:MMPL family transporter [Cohnella thailandensis]MBB6638184.1 MMPL family transporter [Cohnella thailandensis]MBP1977817.1 RND superfamily putative drug exporter [Cohnella thailandensis]